MNFNEYFTITANINLFFFVTLQNSLSFEILLAQLQRKYEVCLKNNRTFFFTIIIHLIDYWSFPFKVPSFPIDTLFPSVFPSQQSKKASFEISYKAFDEFVLCNQCCLFGTNLNFENNRESHGTRSGKLGGKE